MNTDLQAAVYMKNLKERRREHRESAQRRVTITNLAQLKVPFPGKIVDTSNSGLKMVVSKPLQSGASLAIEWDDTCVLGDVVYCSETELKYTVGVRTNYVIFDRTPYHRARAFADKRKNN